MRVEREFSSPISFIVGAITGVCLAPIAGPLALLAGIGAGAVAHYGMASDMDLDHEEHAAELLRRFLEARYRGEDHISISMTEMSDAPVSLPMTRKYTVYFDDDDIRRLEEKLN